MVDMQPSSMIGSGPVQGVSSPTSCMSNASQIASLHAPMLSHEQHQHLASQQHLLQQHYEQNGQHPQQNIDDFLEQMFLMPWEMNANNSQQSQSQKLFTMSLLPHQEPGSENNLQYGYEESALLASRLRQHELGENVGMNMGGNHVSEGMNDSNSSPGRSMMLQLSTGNPNSPQLMNTMSNSPRGPVTSPPQLPLSLGQGKPGEINENAREGFFPPFQGSARGARPPNFQPQLQQIPSFGSMPQQQQQHTNPAATSPVGAPPTRPRVRARRGQATDPHSIAERLRRERIAERMKQLQELVPNSNKTDKASMLDEIIDYVKFLQLQVKVLSMSRLGGAGAVAPLVADVPKEGGNGQAARSNGAQNNSADGMALTERQVAKLMEEDMGSAMQYLQGKGLCLMPISLASAISSTNKTSMQSQQQKQASLQALLSGNANVGNEQTTSSLSAITTISSPTDVTASESAKHVSREANSTTKTNE